MAPAAKRELSYPVRAVVRLTGLSEHLLRAWERRYGAVTPQRTPGGSRRYSQADVDRLRRLAAAVKAGHPISELAALDDRQLAGLSEPLQPDLALALREALAAIERLDAGEVERLLGLQLAGLGPRVFALDFVLPLLHEVGDRWERGELPVAAEHLSSGIVRSLLGAALRANARASAEAPMLFTTPSDERHEFGVLVAALLAVAAGRNPLNLGPDLPAAEVRTAVERTGAAVVVVGLTSLAPAEAAAYLEALRRQLPDAVELWVGGGVTPLLPHCEGVAALADFDEFEARALTLRPDPPE